MKTPASPSGSLERLRQLTPARVGLGRAGASLPTAALLGFTLDHARARDAVHAAFDHAGLVAGLRGLGQRPGLSAPDSPGVYLTFAPRIGLTDAERNCVSNIHRAGLGYDEAAAKIAWLVREGLARQITGVALKDESGGGTAQRIATDQS